MSGLHHALVSHLCKLEHRCCSEFVTYIRIHSLHQVGTACKLSVEVRREILGEVSYNFFNVCI